MEDMATGEIYTPPVFITGEIGIIFPLRKQWTVQSVA